MTVSKHLLAIVVGVASAALIGCATTSNASPAQQAQITARINQLFSAMRQRDEAVLRNLFTNQFTLITVDEQTGARITISSPDAFVDLVKGAPDELNERIWDPEIRIDGDLATLWAPYDFHLGGAYSHSGIDAFQLVRMDGQWKIASVAYTRRKGESPPEGAPSK